MTELERFKVRIGDDTFDLTLPGNGRFEVEQSGWVLFCIPRDSDWFYLIGEDGEIIDHLAFPDACDNAAEWFVDQTGEYCATEKNAGRWRAAKRAHLALKEDAMATPTRNSTLSPAALCRANGWGVGTQLIGDEGHGDIVITITAVGEALILVRGIFDEGKQVDWDEGLWTLNCREWREIKPCELLALMEARDGGE